eukprot:TRINITY_DN2589_c2_g1_i1.p1 TRINITY_DN2589_c2_g1~~TRINITY_DN2589_c2_g1_i1.p1  ORF type:complete len:491 (+),score=137.17 TRINITY_DN2589_c2_g1_i1:58-1530(+)
MGWEHDKEEGTRLFKAGDARAAAKMYRRAAESGGGGDAVLHSNLAMALLKAGDAAGCLASAEAALGLDPSLEKARYRRAKALLLLNRPEEAAAGLRADAGPALRDIAAEARGEALPCEAVGAVEVRSSDIHGFGVYATRDIAAGEVLLSERAVVTVSAVAEDGQARSWQQMGVIGVERLCCSAKHKRALKRMHSPCKCSSDVEFFFTVWDANAHLIQDPDFRIGEEMAGPPGVGLFPCVSRLNHSCRPNTAPSFKLSHTSGTDSTPVATQVVRAIKPIRQGEEIFASFIGLVTGYTARQHKLRAMHFPDGCHCERCAEERDDRGELDRVVCGCGEASPAEGACRCGAAAVDPSDFLRIVDSIETKGWRSADRALDDMPVLVPQQHWARAAVALARARESVAKGTPDGGAARLALESAEKVCPPAWPLLVSMRVLAAVAESGRHTDPAGLQRDLLTPAATAHDVCFGGGPDLFAARYHTELRLLGVGLAAP